MSAWPALAGQQQSGCHAGEPAPAELVGRGEQGADQVEAAGPTEPCQPAEAVPDRRER